MIIEYSFGNYRSFKDRTTFSMKATSQTTFNDTLIRKFNERILPSSIVYGANASGKTNIVSSLETLRNIVLSGTLSSVANLEIYPFLHDDKDDPIYFHIDFTNSGSRFLYILEINVGKLKKGLRSVCHEVLHIVANKKPIMIFERDLKCVRISKDPKILEMLEADDVLVKKLEEKLNDNLDNLELFLSRGFKSTISSKIAGIIIDFFKNKLFPVKDFTLQSFNLEITSDEEMGKNFSVWNKLLQSFVEGADFGPQQIFFKKKNNNDEHTANMKLYSVYKQGNTDTLIPSEWMESRGTLKLIDFAIAFQTLFHRGGILVVDEFDAALHPELVKGIISLFNNQEINSENAQLIFTTHNPIYLSNKIFRRDQIRFVEKDKETYKSTLYSLADFGSTDVRNDENFLINYFKGKYSSLPYIDFAAILKSKEDNNNV